MKTEWHPCLAALAVQVGDPFEVERTGMFARFATHRYLFDQLGVEIGGEVDALEHGGHDDEPVSEGQRHEQRQAPVGAVLILDGTSHGHVVIAVAPVGREAPVEALDALGEEKETAVPAPAYNLPYPVAPSVGLLYQQVGYFQLRRRSRLSGKSNDAVLRTSFDGRAAPKAASSR